MSLKRKRSFDDCEEMDVGEGKEQELAAKHQRMMCEESLPYDLWLHVFTFLPIEDLIVSVPQTCSFFSHIVKDPLIWKKLTVQLLLNGDETLIATKGKCVPLVEFLSLWEERDWKERYLSLYPARVGLILTQFQLSDKIKYFVRQEHTSLCCQETHGPRCRHPQWSWPVPKCKCPFFKRHPLVLKEKKDQVIEYEELDRVCQVFRTIAQLDVARMKCGNLSVENHLRSVYQYSQSCNALDRETFLREEDQSSVFCAGSLYLRLEPSDISWMGEGSLHEDCVVDDSIMLLTEGSELKMCRVCDYVTTWDIELLFYHYSTSYDVRKRQGSRNSETFVEFRQLEGGRVLRTKLDPRPASVLGNITRLFEQGYVFPRLFIASLIPLVFRIEIFFKICDKMPRSRDFLNLIHHLAQFPDNERLDSSKIPKSWDAGWCRVAQCSIHRFLSSENGTALDVLSLVTNEGKGSPKEQKASSKEEEKTLSSKHLRVTLFDYQERAVAWMLERESSDRDLTLPDPRWKTLTMIDEGGEKRCLYCNFASGEMTRDHPPPVSDFVGGMNCEEMGLGKTLEMITLITATKGRYASAPPKQEVTSVKRGRKTTDHFEGDIFNRLGKPEEGVRRSGRNLKKVENLVRSTTAPIYLSSSTLIIVPSTLLHQWEQEFKAHLKPGVLSMQIYDPVKRQDKPALTDKLALSFLDFDVVLTTYDIVSKDLMVPKARAPREYTLAGARDSPLLRVFWSRIILDEAHLLKNTSSVISKYCTMMRSQTKWVVTGTPIPNKIDDLYGILTFLRCDPYQQALSWKRCLRDPVQIRQLSGIQDMSALLQRIMIRHEKKDVQNEIKIPGRKCNIVFLSLGENQKKDYLFTHDRALYYNKIPHLSTFTNHSLNTLREVCSSVGMKSVNLLSESLSNGVNQVLAAFGHGNHHELLFNRIFRVIKEAHNRGFFSCSICSQASVEPHLLGCCGVIGCYSCLLKSDLFDRQVRADLEEETDSSSPSPSPSPSSSSRLQQKSSSATNMLCPRCSSHFEEQHFLSFNETPQSSDVDFGCKVSYLTNKISSLLRKKPDLKILVFSQFKRTLSAVAFQLASRKINFVRFDGSGGKALRGENVTRFKSDPSLNILLMSTQLAACGLTLIEASYLFLMDPLMQREIEEQAVGRCHRIGQTSEVIVEKLIVEGSIEERILEEQKKGCGKRNSVGMRGKEQVALKKLWVENLLGGSASSEEGVENAGQVLRTVEVQSLW